MVSRALFEVRLVYYKESYAERNNTCDNILIIIQGA